MRLEAGEEGEVAVGRPEFGDSVIQAERGNPRVVNFSTGDFCGGAQALELLDHLVPESRAMAAWFSNFTATSRAVTPSEATTV